MVAFCSAKEHFLLARKDAQDKQSSTERCILCNILTILLTLYCSCFPEPVSTKIYVQIIKHKYKNKFRISETFLEIFSPEENSHYDHANKNTNKFLKIYFYFYN